MNEAKNVLLITRLPHLELLGLSLFRADVGLQKKNPKEVKVV